MTCYSAAKPGTINVSRYKAFCRGGRGGKGTARNACAARCPSVRVVKFYACQRAATHERRTSNTRHVAPDRHAFNIRAIRGIGHIKQIGGDFLHAVSEHDGNAVTAASCIIKRRAGRGQVVRGNGIESDKSQSGAAVERIASDTRHVFGNS